MRAALAAALGRDDLAFEVTRPRRGQSGPPNQMNGADNPEGGARNRRVAIVYQAA